MELFLSGSSYRYECENLCRLFFPYSPVKVEAWDQPGPPSPGEGPWAWAVIEGGPGAYSYQVTVSDGERALTRQAGAPALEEYSMTDLLYNAFVELTGNHPAWGMLTGIHPVKLLRQYVEERGEEEGLAHFQGHCYVTPPKAELAHRVLRAQGPAVEALRENDFSLYVSIPFCPTRCAYCSFVSQDMEHAKKLMDPYFQLLLEEIEKVAQVTKDLGLSLVSVYIGGGTPTTLSARQLSALCGKIRQVFDFSRCGEFTVEAGRPDTITQEKLLALREAGISRISINPQSLSDQVLRNIGRRHTAQDVVEAFRLAQRLGFSNINADLIVGLPGDDLDGSLFGHQALRPAQFPRRGFVCPQQRSRGRRHGGLLHPAPHPGGLRALLPLPPDPHGRQPGEHRLGQARLHLPVQHLHHGRVQHGYRLRGGGRLQGEGPLQRPPGAHLQLQAPPGVHQPVPRDFTTEGRCHRAL